MSRSKIKSGLAPYDSYLINRITDERKATVRECITMKDYRRTHSFCVGRKPIKMKTLFHSIFFSKKTKKGRHPLARKEFFLALSLLLSLPLLFSCAKQSYYDIDTRTDIEKNGNTVIRWQVNPGMEGRVKIFASRSAVSYPTDPIAVELISKQSVTLPFPASGYETQYYLMVFGGRESRVVSTRAIPTLSFTNLRDIGGYMTKEGEQVQWGRIYRGNGLDRLPPADRKIVATLEIKNQIYLKDCTDSGDGLYPSRLQATQITLDPDKEYHNHRLRDRILLGEMDRPAVIHEREMSLADYAFKNSKQLSSALHFLLDESNYPVLLSDSLGNGRVAVLTALIQSALGVPLREIIEDYMLSNSLTPISKLEPEGYKYPPLIQESLIELHTNRPNDLQYVFYRINRRYGSVEKYLDKELSFDKSDIAKLRSILLY